MDKNTIQGYLGAVLGIAVVVGVVTGRLETYPSTWSWSDSADWFNSYFYVWTSAAILYYPTIFGIRAFMKDKEPFDLGGAKSKGLINWVFWWETGLAIFSILGAYHVVPKCLEPFGEGKGWVENICGASSSLDNPSSGYWVHLFCVSKLFEFGDTIFVVLRKKKLILLQHYHHLATMLYCWAVVVYVRPEHNNAVLYFAGMNLCVHSVMYTWYAATRTGWRSPRLLMMLVTLLQLVQMVGGVIIVLTTLFTGGTKGGCPDPTSRFALVMYASYFVLFVRLFINNYITKPKRRSRKATKKQS